MAFRELEPSTLGALAAFADGVAGGETPTRPSKWARNSDPDHLQKLDEHEGGTTDARRSLPGICCSARSRSESFRR
jgi:hypothetical protein